MRALILLRLVLILAMGIAAGPRPAFAVDGEIVCGLGAVAYDFGRGRPALPTPGAPCDLCLVAKAFLPPPVFLTPEAGPLLREEPARRAETAHPRRAPRAKHARAPPLKFVL